MGHSPEEHVNLVYVPQQAFIFTGTLEENIRLGTDATLNQVKLAAEQALDVQTERNVMKHLIRFMQDKAGLLVTHRLEVARQCSRILVMEQG